MASLNRVFILGNLGGDPELKVTPGGMTVTTFNVATNDIWTDKNGNRQERTEWHRVVVWGKQAEHCNQYLKKGRTVFIEGRIRSRQWEDKQGQKRVTTEIVATSVQFIGGPTRQATEETPEPPGRELIQVEPIAEDDMPF